MLERVEAWTIAQNSVFFLMDHHCFSFLMAHFENWCFTLKDHHSFVSGSSSLSPLRWYLHCCLTSRGVSYRAHHTLALQNQVIKAGLGFFFPLVFSIYQRIVPVKSDFHWWQPWWVYKAGWASSMCGDSTGMWGWRQGCSPDPELKQPCWLCPRYNPACSRALGVLRLDFSLAGEAEGLPHEWGPCQPFMGSLMFCSVPQFCYWCLPRKASV